MKGPAKKPKAMSAGKAPTPVKSTMRKNNSTTPKRGSDKKLGV